MNTRLSGFRYGVHGSPSESCCVSAVRARHRAAERNGYLGEPKRHTYKQCVCSPGPGAVTAVWRRCPPRSCCCGSRTFRCKHRTASRTGRKYSSLPVPAPSSCGTDPGRAMRRGCAAAFRPRRTSQAPAPCAPKHTFMCGGRTRGVCADRGNGVFDGIGEPALRTDTTVHLKTRKLASLKNQLWACRFVGSCPTPML